MIARQRIAVIGSGISGLSAAWLLRKFHEVVLFEAADRLGGHTHTVAVEWEGETFPVDTGFLVFNEKTYPNLIALFAVLGVESVEAEMSFAVSLENPELEWAGSSLATLFGQKRNLARPQFWSMLADIARFNRASAAWLARGADHGQTLKEYLIEGRYSKAFAEWYLLPMAAAIWSCPSGQMLEFPASTLIRFCQNHGLLQIFDRPTWRTIKGGGIEYVGRMAAQIPEIRLSCPVRAITRQAAGLQVSHARGDERFDQVVLACHSDQALALLGPAATESQRAALSAIRYQSNRAALHTDRALLPRDRRLWSAWNYLAGGGEPGQQPVSVSYLINRLQPLPSKTPVVVTLNPAREPARDRLIAEFEYAHPVFDGPAIAAQKRLDEIQGNQGLWLCGAWSGHGFHEDGLKSALRVANALGARAPWQVEGTAIHGESAEC
ncbi:MAG: FAD-dependent oxidoreductase [Candidatus Competibacteraceae bacterium]|nr:FAD-dependent oxidoreductase [Candidatus Competibacteraceae bacterium]